MNFVDVIPVKDVFHHILSGCKLKSIIHVLKTCKVCKTAIENDRLWEMLYRKHFLCVPHIDLSHTWLKSYSETHKAIWKTSKLLIKELLLIDSKYLNKRKLTRDVFARLVKCISELKTWEFDIDNICRIEDDFGDLIMFLDGTINESKRIKLDDVDHFECQHGIIILDLFEKFGFEF